MLYNSLWANLGVDACFSKKSCPVSSISPNAPPCLTCGGDLHPPRELPNYQKSFGFDNPPLGIRFSGLILQLTTILLFSTVNSSVPIFCSLCTTGHTKFALGSTFPWSSVDIFILPTSFPSFFIGNSRLIFALYLSLVIGFNSTVPTFFPSEEYRYYDCCFWIVGHLYPSFLKVDPNYHV